MKLDVDKPTVEYIKEKGAVINVDLFVADNCCGGITEPVVNIGEPKLRHQFDEHIIDDVKIYVSKFIHLKGDTLTIQLKKFLGIKHLSVSGVKML